MTGPDPGKTAGDVSEATLCTHHDVVAPATAWCTSNFSPRFCYFGRSLCVNLKRGRSLLLQCVGAMEDTVKASGHLLSSTPLLLIVLPAGVKKLGLDILLDLGKQRTAKARGVLTTVGDLRASSALGRGPFSCTRTYFAFRTHASQAQNRAHMGQPKQMNS